MLKNLIRVLILGSCLVIDPWGVSDAQIYLYPKILCLFLWVLAESLNVKNFRAMFSKENIVTLAPFAVVLTLTTVLSVNVTHSVIGYEKTGMGFFYWLLVIWFFAVNKAFVNENPDYRNTQLVTLLQGVGLNGVIALGQYFSGLDPSGTFSHSELLVPFMLMGLASLIQFHGHFSNKAVQVYAISLSLPFLILDNRTVFLVLPYLFYKIVGKKTFLSIVVCSAIFFSSLSSYRSVPIGEELSHGPIQTIVRDVSSDRVWLYKQSVKWIMRSPTIGYGINGVSTAYAYRDCVGIYDDIYIDINGYVCYDSDDLENYYEPKVYLKIAYNLVLNRLLEFGLAGLIAYLWVLYRWRTVSVVLISYLTYTFFWFDSSYFYWLLPWAASLLQMGQNDEVD